MATAKPGIILNSISGRIGNVVFYTRPGARHGARIQCVRRHVIPRNPDTEAQRAVRRAFHDAVHLWQAMTEDEKHTYNRKARYINMSGYNLYISKYMRTVIRNNTSGSILSAAQAHPINSLSFPWNLELSTWNSLRFPSVSNTYLKGTGKNSFNVHLIKGPG